MNSHELSKERVYFISEIRIYSIFVNKESLIASIVKFKDSRNDPNMKYATISRKTET